MGDRPGRIEKCQSGYTAHCEVCLYSEERVTYQEASIWLTLHLDEYHAGWDASDIVPLQEHEKVNR